MTVISKHAIKRLAERRGLKHVQRHINKINSWGLPEDGITIHKGWAYVTRGGVLVTVHGTKELAQICREGEDK